MRYLLDTHTFLWYIGGNDQLSTMARNAIESSHSQCFISLASFWEIAIKINIGKLITNRTLRELKNGAESTGFEIQQIHFEYFVELMNLPFFHRDPFDRILAATCIYEKFQFITKDQTFKEYGLQTVW